MLRIDRWMLVAVVAAAGLQLSACGKSESKYTKIEPAHVESIEGSKLKRITLTEKAIERLAVKTSIVRETNVAASGAKAVMRKVVPYSSIIYDTQGNTWVYINPKPRNFVRQSIDVERIEGDSVILKGGPAKDTAIATVGAAELYGVEAGIGH